MQKLTASDLKSIRGGVSEKKQWAFDNKKWSGKGKKKASKKKPPKKKKKAAKKTAF